MGVYSGSALLGESVETMDLNESHILDTLIESAQNEMNMFNAVINLDFMEAYNEAGMIILSVADGDSASENAQKNIGKKIKEFFKKVIAKIKQFVATFIAKVQNLLRNDAKLYKEYKDNFVKNGVGYKLSRFRKLNDYGEIISEWNSTISDTTKEINSGIRSIDQATSIDIINKAMEGFNKNIKGGETIKERSKTREDINTGLEGLFFASEKAEEDYKLTTSDVAIIAGVVNLGSNKIINAIKTIGKSGERFCDNTVKSLKLDKAAVKVKDDDLAMAKWNAKYKIATKSGNVISSLTSKACSAAARYTAEARRAFVIVGKNATATNVKESYGMDIEVYDEILGEASDYYVEKSLQMA